MCRLAVAFGRFSNAREVLTSIGASLVRAASMDPYGRDFLSEERHSDGWGVFLLRVGKSSALYHRSVKPIFVDNAVDVIEGFLSNVGGDDAVLAMMHARAASTGTPINIFSTHPVRAETTDGYELYMIHNGSFYRDDIAREVGIDKEYAGRFNDTYIANLALARRVKDDINRDDLAWLLRFVRTGANLGIALVRDGLVTLIVGSYYRVVDDEKKIFRERYYRLYQCELPGGFVYASSTVIDFYSPNFVGNCRVLSNGEYHKYYIYGDGMIKFDESWRFQ
ncbi:class II glutamine amidotransferase [Vulcanisaeta sp. JCM 14467]